jgi:hypothetical protein
MRTVQIYIGREVTDIDCIRVTFTLDGQTQTINVPRIDFLNDRPEYLYNADLTEGDYIITEDGDYITTETGDYLITEQSVFTPSISIYWSGTQWIIVIIINGVEYTYNSLSDVYYPYLSNWEVYLESPELEYLVTSPCTDLKYERIELFDDEKINITLNVQNLSDISKTFTDFSQSFTVPGSSVNNQIFEHFYQNDVDGTIDHNLKRPAFIEIDFVPFRQGVISLEKANMKNGLVDNYSISFYGQLTSLKDIFGETKINQLDLSALGFTYNATNVQNRITDTATDYDVRFPLISNDSLWTYADGGANDITTNGGSIEYTELFPAVKVARLFDAMQNDFNLTFVGSFFSDPRFTSLFLQCKNAVDMRFITQVNNVSFLSLTSTTSAGNNYFTQDYVDIPNSSITINVDDALTAGISSFEILLDVTTASSSDLAYLEVYKNGVYDSTIDVLGTGVYSLVAYYNSYPFANEVYTFKIKSTVPITLEMDIIYNAYYFNENDPLGIYVNSSTITTNTNVLTANLDVRNHMPDMRVTDFLSGIMRQFNFTCVGIDERQFEMIPLEDWYNNGATIDVTKYMNAETADISKVPLFRNIAFRYQQSEAFTNRTYFAISNSEYGNTDNVFEYDGGEYIVESPFENLLFAESVGIDPNDKAILGYFLNINYQSYIPKPTLLYINENTGTLPVPIKFYNGTTNVNLTNYTLFGQDVEVNGVNYSLNFGADNSIILKETIQNGLFATYYFSYLSNLYNLKQRLTTVKAMLPLSVITNIQLNDRLVIRDKRYIINDIKMELTTGEATLTLYNDFRDINLQNYRIVDSGLNVVLFVFVYREGNNSATITRTPAGMTLSTNTINWVGDDREPKVVAGTVSVNTSGLPRKFTVTTTYVNGAQLFNYVIQEA